MQSLSLLFAIGSFTSAVGSLLMCLVLLLRWGRSKITAKAALLGVCGWFCNGFLQAISGCVFLTVYYNTFEWGLFFAGLGISAFCTVCVYIAKRINEDVPAI